MSRKYSEWKWSEKWRKSEESTVRMKSVKHREKVERENEND